VSKAAQIVFGFKGLPHRKVPALLTFVLLCPLMLRAADLSPTSAVGASPTAGLSKFSASPRAVAAAAAMPAKGASEETIFFTVNAGGHRVIGRTNAAGRCKAFLGRVGAGWTTFPDPRLDGDDLMAATSPGSDHWILLSSRGGAGANLWLVSLDGRSMERLTDDERGLLDPADVVPQSRSLSPDGQTLAWVQRGRAWVMDLVRREPRTLGLETDVRAVSWSPDGSWLGLVAGDSVHKIGPDGEPDLLLSPYGCKQATLLWDPAPKSDQLYFMGGGVRRVDNQRRTNLVQPSPVQPNYLSLFSGGKEGVFLDLAADGAAEVYRVTLGGKPQLTQVTQGGASAVWASGQNIYFLRENQLWRCDADGTKARPLVMPPVKSVSIGSMPPLQGVCP
jgi:hypothetical protein